MPYKTNPRFEYPIYYGADLEILKLARLNRKQMTVAENMLWKHIKERKVLGMKFRRQHPVACFIADFYCHQLKLIVEIDGGYHDDQEQHELDQGREKELQDMGLTIIRFWNEEVEKDVYGVVERIGRVITQMGQVL